MTLNNARGLVFNIQRYSIHDGPGIRTTIFFKGCPLRCFWCQNPESQATQPEIFFDKGRCVGCGQCVAICPVGASSLATETSIIDRSTCTGCGKCVDVCTNEARRLIGKHMTVDEVMCELLKDVRFYENSGGGITLSGGEPTAQPNFALAILKRCKEARIHTTLDTCGYAPWPVMEELLEYTDLVLYDIKHMNQTRHREGTGITNRLILNNARRIHKQRPMRVRVPLIHGFNDRFHDVKAIAQFVRRELGSVQIDLLPYNRMGEVKYERLDRRRVSLESSEDEYVQACEAIFSQEASKLIGLVPSQ